MYRKIKQRLRERKEQKRYITQLECDNALKSEKLAVLQESYDKVKRQLLEKDATK